MKKEYNSFLMQPSGRSKPSEMQRKKEGKKMEKLKMIYERVEEGKKEKIFESDDFNSCLNWTITGLYDVAVKRSKAKIDQYYVDGVEYCKIKITYNRVYDNVKDVYTIYNWRNEWGNFINVQKTFTDNGKEI